MMMMMILKSGGVLETMIPFVAMVIMEGCTIALTIWAKTVITNGMSPFVFVVYTHTLSSLFLLPFSFFYHRNDHRTEQYSIFSLSMFLRLFFMGLTGITIPQNLAFLGLAYSSPIVVCAMGLTLPAFSFIISIIIRKINIDVRSSSFQMKAIGAMVCFIGASVVELYKGPIIRRTSSLHLSLSLSLLSKNRYLIFSSTTEFWILGGLLLAASSVSISVWNILQIGAVKEYSQPMKIASFFSIMGTIQSAVLSFFVLENDIQAWKLNVNMEIPLIILTATFVGLIRSSVHIWCMKMKGPFYVPMFKPFGLLFATTFGVNLPASTLRYGSVIGTAIVAMGYLTVMYGQMSEDKSLDKKVNIGDVESGTHESANEEIKVPLLQDFEEVGV